MYIMTAISMYRIPPLFQLNHNIDLPACMYTMKSIYEPLGMETPESGVSGEPTVVDQRLAELERKQEEIIRSLCNLTERLKELKAEVLVPVTQGTPSVPPPVPNTISLHDKPLTNNYQRTVTGFVDVVMYASPSQPAPLSLLVLYELLRTKFSVFTTVHVHSEVRGVNPQLRNFFPAGNPEGQRAQHQVALTLIWKEVGDDLLMTVNPVKQSHVAGEVNVARYLWNLLESVDNRADAVRDTEADSWLDVANYAVLRGNHKERQATLRTLNSNLGKSRYVTGDEFGVADIFMWSVLTQCGLTEDAPTNVKKWLGECKSKDVFKAGVRFAENVNQ